MMSFVVQSERFLPVALRQSYNGVQDHFRELPRAILIFLHDAYGLVAVVDYGDLVGRAQMQIPEHVARGKTCDEQLLGIVAGGVSAKIGIARSRDFRFAGSNDFMIAAIALVSFRAFAIVAGPLDPHRIIVLLHAFLRSEEHNASADSGDTAELFGHSTNPIAASHIERLRCGVDLFQPGKYSALRGSKTSMPGIVVGAIVDFSNKTHGFIAEQ